MPQQIIDDKDVVSLVKKEFERKFADYCKKNGLNIEEPEEEKKEDGSDEDQDKISKPEKLDINMLKKSVSLRIKHKNSGLEYYIRSVSLPNKLVSLETPEGTLFQIDFDELQNEYVLG